MNSLRSTIKALYDGQNTRSRRFRYGLILFDSLTIIYFIATAALPSTPVITAVNAFFGLFILFDLAARLWISTNLRKELTRIYTLADLVVVISLVLAPLMAESFAFLRVLRGLRLIHAYHLLHDLRRESAFFRKHEDAILAAVNLLVFIFVITSLVFVLTFEEDAGVAGYHGYWTQDFERTNPHFGDIARLRELVDVMHQNDIKVIVDIVALFVVTQKTPQQEKDSTEEKAAIRGNPHIAHSLPQENTKESEKGKRQVAFQVQLVRKSHRVR